MPNDFKASRDLVDSNEPATPDLSHIVSFVNDRKPSTANFEIPLLDVNSLDKLIKSLPTNVASGLDGISAPLLKLISPVILKVLPRF